MRIVVHEYADGTRYAFSTDNDGEHEQPIAGARRPGARIRAVVEVTCDDDAEGQRAALAALDLVKPRIAPAA